MAGSNDFTGQNIQDTYQRVLQISSSSQLADGTGSLIPFLNVSASYAFTASIEITKEISSSNADSASLVMLSTQPNITSLGTLTELNVNGNITASNNISASGTIISSNLSGTNTGDQDLSNLVTNDQTASFAVTGSDVIFGNITASGDISASGNIHSSNLIIKDSSKIGTANGVINQDTYIQLVDNDNQIIISSDGDETVQIQSGVVGIGGAPGATNPLTVYGNISSSGHVIASRIYGNADGAFITTANGQIQSSTGFVGTNITASGNISASGDIVGASLNILSNTSGLGYKISEPSTDNLLFAAADGGGFTNFSFKSQVTVQDEFFSAAGMTHEGDTDTKITFGTDQITLTAGNVDMITLDENGNDILTFGNVQTKFEGHITASGNISASAGSVLNVPLRHLDQTVQNITGSRAQGDIYYAQSAVATVPGKIYILQTNGNQALADKDAEVSAASLMGVAIGTNSGINGYLLRGMVKLHTNPFPGENALGSHAYLGDDGLATGSIAGHASDDFIRIIGYGISGSGTVYFDPDKTFIKKA